MTAPSVGRIVHYVARGSADGVFPAVCRAAIITEVGIAADNQMIRCAVFHPDGVLFADRITYSKPDDTREQPHVGGTWHWPERTDG